MNVTETNARFSVAISLLNNLRHWLIDREGAKLKKDEINIFLESIEMNKADKLSSNMILYSFQGFGDEEHSAAIELCDALAKTANKFSESGKETAVDQLIKLLRSEDKDSAKKSLKDDDKKVILKLITSTMLEISKDTEVKPDSIFKRKKI